MWAKLGNFVSNNLLFLWLGSFIVTIITYFFIFLKMHPGLKPMALHYNVLVGVDEYGPGYWLYLIPTAGLATLAVNFIFDRAVKKSNSFLSFLSACVSFGVQVVLFAAAIFLSRIN